MAVSLQVAEARATANGIVRARSRRDVAGVPDAKPKFLPEVALRLFIHCLLSRGSSLAIIVFRPTSISERPSARNHCQRVKDATCQRVTFDVSRRAKRTRQDHRKRST